MKSLIIIIVALLVGILATGLYQVAITEQRRRAEAEEKRQAIIALDKELKQGEKKIEQDCMRDFGKTCEEEFGKH